HDRTRESDNEAMAPAARCLRQARHRWPGRPRFCSSLPQRTNRSGIIAGGVIGGQDQTGRWLIDARFNKTELVARIRRIARYRSRINLYQMDALAFTKQVVPNLGPKTFAFYDPPYIENGEDLYLNDYDLAGHRQLAADV